MTGKEWKNFTDNGDWMCQKEPEKDQGKLTGKKKRERER